MQILTKEVANFVEVWETFSLTIRTRWLDVHQHIRNARIGPPDRVFHRVRDRVTEGEVRGSEPNGTKLRWI